MTDLLIQTFPKDCREDSFCQSQAHSKYKDSNDQWGELKKKQESPTPEKDVFTHTDTNPI